MKEAKQTKSAKVRKTAVKKTDESATMQISMYGVDGKEAKKVDVSKHLFTSSASPKIVAQYIRVYLANQRQGNVSTKGRSEVVGTTAKVYRQKGTGRARHGSKKANLFVGGGVTFGPKPRDYSLKLNKKQRRLALIHALSIKMHHGAVAGLLDEVLTMKPKTKTIAALMKNMNMTDTKTLIVLPKMERNGLVLAARNLPKVNLAEALTINPYVIMANDRIVFVEEALKVVDEHFKG